MSWKLPLTPRQLQLRRATGARWHARQGPDLSRVQHANRRAKRFGVPGRLTTEDARRVMAIGRCFYCGATDKLGLDHRIPMARGGPNTVENLVCACRSCNASKANSAGPRRWAWSRDNCVGCGQSDRRHVAFGLCTRCYQHPIRRKLGLEPVRR